MFEAEGVAQAKTHTSLENRKEEALVAKQAGVGPGGGGSSRPPVLGAPPPPRRGPQSRHPRSKAAVPVLQRLGSLPLVTFCP